MALTQQQCSDAYSWLPVTIEFAGTNLDAVDLTANILAIVDTLQATSLDHCCYHTKFTGPEGYGGMNILATDPADNGKVIIQRILYGAFMLQCYKFNFALGFHTILCVYS